MKYDIQDCLEGKYSEIVCLLTYLADPVTTKELKDLSQKFGWNNRKLDEIATFFSYAMLIKTKWLNYMDRSYQIDPEFFFMAATFFLKNKADQLKQYAKLFPHRSGNAEFLWAVAEALFKGEKDIASKVAGSFPKDSGVDYISLANDNGALNGYALKLGNDEFSQYILERTRAHTLYNNSSPAVLENLLNLVSEYTGKGLWKNHFNFNYPFARLQATYFLCTGKVANMPVQASQLYSTPAIEAILSLYKGNYSDASKLFAESLKRRNLMFADKNFYYDPLLSFFLILSYKLSDTDKDRTKVTQFLGKKAVRESAQLHPAVLAADYLNKPESPHLKDFLESASRQYQWLPLNVELIAALQGHFGFEVAQTAPNYAIVKHELSPYIKISDTEKQQLEKTFGGTPLISRFKRLELWESVISDIDRLVSAPAAEEGAAQDEGKSTRVAYFYDEYNRTLQIKSQTRLKSGKWSAGKRISYSDYSASPDYMDDTDRKIAQMALRGYDGPCVRLNRALPLLIGSDRVFGGIYAPYKELEIVEEKPFLAIQKKGQSYQIVSNFPKTALLANETTACDTSSKDRIKVISINQMQAKILSSMLSLPSFPLQSEGRLKELLSKLAPHIEIHSELLEGGSSLENIKGSTLIHIKIQPSGDGYLTRLCVRPLEGGKLELYPGEGDRTVYDEADGTRYQVTRTLSKEKKALKELGDYCFDELDEFDIEDNGKASPEQLLGMVEWASPQEDKYVLEWPSDKKIKVYRAKDSSISIHSVAGEQWFKAEGQIDYSDSDSVSLEKILSLINSGNLTGNYIRLDDENYISLTDTLRKQVRRLEAISSSGKDGVQISRFNIGALAELVHSRQMHIEADKGVADLEKRITEASRLEPEVPANLNATLRDYQVEGFRWMVRLSHWGAGACLADDMGLGKTVQAIAFILYKASEGASLVVAPASVVMNWQKEFARFAPTLRITVLNNEGDRDSTIDSAGPGDVIISTYGLLAHGQEHILAKDWNVVCLDEAHTIKNRQTKTSGSAMQLKASSRLILTGTPVQNYLGELWNLLQFLNPGLMGSFERFSSKFIDASDPDLESLKRIVQPFILRRTKAEVLDELPDKTDIVRTVQLSDAEMLAYETIREKVEQDLEDESKVTVNVLAEITRLRQAACSMALVNKEWKGGTSKLAELSDLVREIISGGNRVLIFSQFTSFLDMVNAQLDKDGVSYFYLNGSTPIRTRSKMVADFQKGEKEAFVVSLKAGGLGLNLTGANYVIHLDPWWNPAIESQATDRAYRIGQKQNVTVYHLISAHTIEEKILRLHDAKRRLADNFLEGTSQAHSLSLDELRALCDGR